MVLDKYSRPVTADVVLEAALTYQAMDLKPGTSATALAAYRQHFNRTLDQYAQGLNLNQEPRT